MFVTFGTHFNHLGLILDSFGCHLGPFGEHFGGISDYLGVMLGSFSDNERSFLS